MSPKQIKHTANDSPVRIRHSPFFDDIPSTKIEYLHHCHLFGEGSLAVGHFAQRRIEAFDRVGSVDHFPYFGGIFEYPLNIDIVVVPDADGGRILLFPLLVQDSKGIFSFADTDSSIYRFEIRAELLTVLCRYVFCTVTYQMHHAAADNGIRKGVCDCLFQSGESVNADEAETLYATGFQFIEYTEPLVCPLIFSDPETKAILPATATAFTFSEK